MIPQPVAQAIVLPVDSSATKGEFVRVVSGIGWHIDRAELGPAQNFVYFIVPETLDRLAVVDPGWQADAIVAHAARLRRPITDIILTHHHLDHRGAVPELLAHRPARVHVHKSERAELKNEGFALDLVLHEGGDVIELGAGAAFKLLHTPGHTPGSMCIHCQGCLITGDTLFVDGCGRCDLPGGDAKAMYHSLHRVLGELPDTTLVLPGHDYGPAATSTLAEQRLSNPYLRSQQESDFIAYRLRPRG